jgi:hypothetical protein
VKCPCWNVNAEVALRAKERVILDDWSKSDIGRRRGSCYVSYPRRVYMLVNFANKRAELIFSLTLCPWENLA